MVGRLCCLSFFVFLVACDPIANGDYDAEHVLDLQVQVQSLSGVWQRQRLAFSVLWLDVLDHNLYQAPRSFAEVLVKPAESIRLRFSEWPLAPAVMPLGTLTCDPDIAEILQTQAKHYAARRVLVDAGLEIETLRWPLADELALVAAHEAVSDMMWSQFVQTLTIPELQRLDKVPLSRQQRESIADCGALARRLAQRPDYKLSAHGRLALGQIFAFNDANDNRFYDAGDTAVGLCSSHTLVIELERSSRDMRWLIDNSDAMRLGYNLGRNRCRQGNEGVFDYLDLEHPEHIVMKGFNDNFQNPRTCTVVGDFRLPDLR